MAAGPVPGSQSSLDEFRRVFPASLCFRQIIPVDEVVTMLQFFRGDEPFARLMLDDAERARLDRLWDELHYVSQDAINVYQNFDQMLNFASQEGETARVEPWRKPLEAANDAAVKVQAASEPKQIAFAPGLRRAGLPTAAVGPRGTRAAGALSILPQGEARP